MKMTKTTGAVAFVTTVALASLVADKYSVNRRGEVVDTRPAASTTIVETAKVSAPEVRGPLPMPPALDLGEDGPLLPRHTGDTGRWIDVDGDVKLASNGREVANITRANAETLRLATAELERTRPIRPTPVIRRIDSWRCEVIAPGSLTYQQGGVVRPITAPFPCPVQGEARARWGSGEREIVVEYGEGETVKVSEVWP